MKTIITLIMSLSLLTITLTTQGKGTPEFLKLEFNKSLSTLDIQNLFTNGFEKKENETVEKIIILKSDSCKSLKELKTGKSKPTEKTEPIESGNGSPNFSKLIFNFI